MVTGVYAVNRNFVFGPIAMKKAGSTSCLRSAPDGPKRRCYSASVTGRTIFVRNLFLSICNRRAVS